MRPTMAASSITSMTLPASVDGMQKLWISGIRCMSGTAMQVQHRNTAADRIGTAKAVLSGDSELPRRLPRRAVA